MTPFRWARRLAWTALSVVALVVVAACDRYPPPVQVPFPDDARVLHGPWQARIDGLFEGVYRAVLSADGDTLLLWAPSHAWRYLRDAPDVWRAEAFPAAEAFRGAVHDPSIDALVLVTRNGASVAARTLDLVSGSETLVQVEPPAAEDVFDTAVGSGRLFAVTVDAASVRRLRWWDARTGAVGGVLAVPNYRDGMRASANGRVLSFWDMSSATVRVVDTVDPSTLHAVPLGLCRSNGLSEASDDGRWFALEDCLGRISLVDLTRPQDGSRATGVTPVGPATFARGSAELIWRTLDGLVRTYDVVSGATTTLLDVGSTNDPEWDLWNDTLVLDRSHDLLVAGVAGGRVRAARLADAASAVDLPELGVDVVSMTLEATPGTGTTPEAESFTSYDFSGTASVAGEVFDVTGQVHADRLHEYVPEPAPSTQAIPAPYLNGWATIDTVPGAVTAFQLSFWTYDREAVVYRGTLDDLDAGITYGVEVARVSP
ncbi:MAG: hypothetical protein R6W77_15695 [Trueperaceae bacterium]